MTVQRNLNLVLPSEMVEQIDEKRGQVPRIAWIRAAIQQRLDQPPPPPAPPLGPLVLPPAVPVDIDGRPTGTVIPAPDTPTTVEAKMKRAKKVVAQAADALGSPKRQVTTVHNHEFKPGKSAMRCADCGLSMARH